MVANMRCWLWGQACACAANWHLPVVIEPACGLGGWLAFLWISVRWKVSAVLCCAVPCSAVLYCTVHVQPLPSSLHHLVVC